MSWNIVHSTDKEKGWKRNTGRKREGDMTQKGQKEGRRG
jgi:hypothetical protein